MVYPSSAPGHLPANGEDFTGAMRPGCAASVVSPVCGGDTEGVDFLFHILRVIQQHIDGEE
jgi:hypothetical protein